MITEFTWTGFADNDAATEFFRQHPKGLWRIERMFTKGVPPKYDGDAGIPGGKPYIRVTCGDGVQRYCTDTVRWEFDGRTFKAHRLKLPA